MSVTHQSSTPTDIINRCPDDREREFKTSTIPEETGSKGAKKHEVALLWYELLLLNDLASNQPLAWVYSGSLTALASCPPPVSIAYQNFGDTLVFPFIPIISLDCLISKKCRQAPPNWQIRND